MHLRLILEQSRPVFRRELLLLQHHLDVARGVVDLAGGGVDVGVEVELDGVGGLLGFRVALEVERGGLDVELDLLFGDVGDGDGEEDVVFLRFGFAAALGPGYCGMDVRWLCAMDVFEEAAYPLE